jgi:hypothetical protein
MNPPLIDLRLAFLACASARLDLIERGLMDLDEAFSRDFVEGFREIGALTCTCEREILDRLEAHHRQMREQCLRKWWRRQS